MSRWKVGTVIGKCRNCNSDFLLSQPFMSKMPVVNDGWYRFHCSNDDCHNSAGIDINVEGSDYMAYRIEEFVDFARFDSEFLKELKDELKIHEAKNYDSNVIDITKYIQKKRKMSVQ